MLPAAEISPQLVPYHFHLFFPFVLINGICFLMLPALKALHPKKINSLTVPPLTPAGVPVSTALHTASG